jgi:dephospho-CoA kinase
MKLVIGIVGPPLAGKETVANTLEALLKKDGFTVSRHRFSDPIRETLTLWGLSHGRENEQLMAQLMVAPNFFGPATLAKAIDARLRKNSTNVGILDGMRWHADEEMLREFPKNGVKSLIVYVTASPDRRYERLRARNRSGESQTTREEFDRQNKARNEIDIPDIGSRADIKLENNHDKVGELQSDIERAYREKIKPLLK